MPNEDGQVVIQIEEEKKDEAPNEIDVDAEADEICAAMQDDEDIIR